MVISIKIPTIWRAFVRKLSFNFIVISEILRICVLTVHNRIIYDNMQKNWNLIISVI
jgi:hypothetical protein